MKIIGIPQQKAKSTMVILLRSLGFNPTVRLPPIMARYLHMQSVQAGNAVEAPMISLAAAKASRVQEQAYNFKKRYSQMSHHTGALSQILSDQTRLFAP